MSEYDFEAFFERSAEMLCIAGADGRFRRVNPAFQRILGWTAGELTGRSFSDFIHPDDIEPTAKEIEKLASGIPAIFFGNRYRCPDDSYRHLGWTAVREPKTGLLFATARTVAEPPGANRRFQLIIDASPAALVMVDQRGFICLVNKESERVFGYSRDELMGKTIEVLVPPDDHARHQRERAAFSRNPAMRPMGLGRHVRAVRRDGTVFPAEVALNPVQLDDGPYVLSTIVDLTFQKQTEDTMARLSQDLESANAALAHLASTDPLTGLFNRRAFDEQLEKQIQLMGRVGRAISLLMIDVDSFKEYNDRYGHPAGDEALRAVGNLLRRMARTTDVVARYGGDEFAVILPNTTQPGALKMADRFRMAVRDHPWELEILTLSTGAATILLGNEANPLNIDYGARLLATADRALYCSKASGRNRVTSSAEITGADQLS
ncbi:MAG TPA: diguanylate cyclase [Thermoanaerobaculia bacterium]|nr:diguanylate cyclase [Thermoanaerobaculia bacterium]